MAKKYTVARKTWVGKTEEERSVKNVSLNMPCHSEGGQQGSDASFTLENVMGQEDIYRTDPNTGERTETNTLIGRIVFSTGSLSTAVIHYGPVFYGTINTFEINEPDDYHEAFIPDLNPNTLYVFYVVVTPENDINPPIQSELYYFETSGEVNEGSSVLIWTDSQVLSKVGVEEFVTGTIAIYSINQPPIYISPIIEVNSVVKSRVTADASILGSSTETVVEYT